MHDNVIKWKHFPCYWLFVRGIHRSPVNSPHKGQWRGAVMFLWSAPWIICLLTAENCFEFQALVTCYITTTHIWGLIRHHPLIYASAQSPDENATRRTDRDLLHTRLLLFENYMLTTTVSYIHQLRKSKSVFFHTKILSRNKPSWGFGCHYVGGDSFERKKSWATRLLNFF